MGHLHVSNLIPASRQEVFDYLIDVPKLIADLEPAIELSLALTTEESTTQLSFPKIKAHAEIPIALRRMGVTAHGMIRVEKFSEPNEISYCQEAGWFRNWRHTIRLSDHGDGKSTLMVDLVDYRLPFGVFGTLADDLFFKGNLSQTLNDRAARMRAHFESRSTAGDDKESTNLANKPEGDLESEKARASMAHRESSAGASL